MKNNLRIIAKRKRKLISLDTEDKNTFLKNINSCLDRVFSIENTIKEVGLYYPIFNEISPLVFIKYFKDNNITTALPVVDINSNSKRIGELRSAVYSPTFNQVIGICMIDKPHFEVNTNVDIIIDNVTHKGILCNIPFV